MNGIDKTKQITVMLSREEREARLDVIADACGRPVDESQVYQAAQLFFALVSSSCFVAGAAITHTVEKELKTFTKHSPEEKSET